jgi:hypothetical protein
MGFFEYLGFAQFAVIYIFFHILIKLLQNQQTTDAFSLNCVQPSSQTIHLSFLVYTSIPEKKHWKRLRKNCNHLVTVERIAHIKDQRFSF